MEAEENKTAQEDEIAALVSIYGEDVQQLASDDYEVLNFPSFFESLSSILLDQNTPRTSFRE